MNPNYNPETPYNDLPLLPPNSDLESKNILKKLTFIKCNPGDP